jgi:hypothetical protein
MGLSTEGDYQHCRGEGCDIPMSEVTLDSQGRRVHHDHFFPTGIPTSSQPAVTANIEQVEMNVVVDAVQSLPDAP